MLNVLMSKQAVFNLRQHLHVVAGAFYIYIIKVEKTNEWKIANVKFKRKLNNDIKLKGLIINKYGDKIKSIYKQKCKKGDKKCCNFIEGFL